MNRAKTFTLSVLMGLVLSGAAVAQTAGTAGLEGYVFDRESGRPVRNMMVILLAKDGPIRATVTDANGFYWMETPVPGPGPEARIAARCEAFWTVKTKKGNKVDKNEAVQSSIGIYPELRDGQVYQRNLTVDLPKDRAACYDLATPTGPSSSPAMSSVIGGAVAIGGAAAAIQTNWWATVTQTGSSTTTPDPNNPLYQVPEK